MSKYEDQIDSCNVICPYCKSEYQPECENYSEEETAEICDDCGMVYSTYQTFDVDHHADPDCELNGMKHKWEPLTLRNGESHDFCELCGMCRPIGDTK